jgi:hypothetical protein
MAANDLRPPSRSHATAVGRAHTYAYCLALVLVILMTSMAGCADTANPLGPDPSHTGTLVGHAMVGPTCPVQRDPPDPDCADRPYSGRLAIHAGDANGAVVQTVATDAAGNFTVDLEPGSYSVTNPADASYPRCAAGPATVRVGAATRLDVLCDSGIR